MDINTLIAVLMTSALSSGLVVFLSKKWIEHSFNARLSSIEAKNRILAYEHQVSFTRYDEKVASALEGAYALVCEYRESVNKTIESAFTNKEELADQFCKETEMVAARFNQYMMRNSIYLSTEMVAKLRETRLALRDAYMEALHDYRRKVDQQGKPLSILVWAFMNPAISDECEALMLELQALVRSHLGRFAARAD
jgi:hypothetical protein